MAPTVGWAVVEQPREGIEENGGGSCPSMPRGFPRH